MGNVSILFSAILLMLLVVFLFCLARTKPVWHSFFISAMSIFLLAYAISFATSPIALQAMVIFWLPGFLAALALAAMMAMPAKKIQLDRTEEEGDDVVASNISLAFWLLIFCVSSFVLKFYF